MTALEAIEIIEDGESELDDLLIAWQFLLDTGLVWQLQGWYGRMAMEMIENGLITPKVTA